MAPTADLISKDAMYLFEIMRDSPHPFLLHIGPYAEKTGQKPNSIVKRLGEIKKRNGLNINTTTNTPGDNKSFTAPRAQATGPRSSGDGATKTAAVKRERKARVPKASTTSDNGDSVKREDTESPANHALPTPAPSPAANTPSPATARPIAITKMPIMAASAAPITNMPTSTSPFTSISVAQIPSFMPQKRTLNEFYADQHANDNNNAIKKVKTETWSFP